MRVDSYTAFLRQSIETGAGSFPLIYNEFEYPEGRVNTLLVEVEDTAGAIKTFLFTFTGMTPEGNQFFPPQFKTLN